MGIEFVQSVNNLKMSLSKLLKDTGLTANLALVLDCTGKTGSISYSKITELVGDNSDDVLLSLYEWRMLLPARVEKSGAWEDRMLLCKPGESYILPNVVRHLVQNAVRTGHWSPMIAVATVFNEMGESAWQKMPELVMALGSYGNCRISGIQIRDECKRAGMGDKVDLLIAELKAAGIMSPKLSTIAEVAKAGSPVYELNPSLIIE